MWGDTQLYRYLYWFIFTSSECSLSWCGWITVHFNFLITGLLYVSERSGVLRRSHGIVCIVGSYSQSSHSIGYLVTILFLVELVHLWASWFRVDCFILVCSYSVIVEAHLMTAQPKLWLLLSQSLMLVSICYLNTTYAPMSISRIYFIASSCEFFVPVD